MPKSSDECAVSQAQCHVSFYVVGNGVLFSQDDWIVCRDDEDGTQDDDSRRPMPWARWPTIWTSRDYAYLAHAHHAPPTRSLAYLHDYVPPVLVTGGGGVEVLHPGSVVSAQWFTNNGFASDCISVVGPTIPSHPSLETVQQHFLATVSIKRPAPPPPQHARPVQPPRARASRGRAPAQRAWTIESLLLTQYLRADGGTRSARYSGATAVPSGAAPSGGGTTRSRCGDSALARWCCAVERVLSRWCGVPWRRSCAMKDADGGSVHVVVRLVVSDGGNESAGELPSRWPRRG
ncbi:hypothetical protein C8J57DRAFT_1727835 [Mycena rebaudengoi]|nr:hypothetical protein C8J57DRAFT_1727835 [Mycena rebaudengoi]